MKGSSAFLDKRRCQDWDHEIFSWKYLTSKDLSHQFPWTTDCLTLHPKCPSGVVGQQLQQYRQKTNATVVAVVQLLANALGKRQFVVDRQVPIDSWQCKIIYVYVVLEVSEGEGNGNPLQHSCQENPMDRGVWWAAIHRVIQSCTWLKRLSMRACIGEGNGNPLLYSCPENPRDGGAWWAAVYGVA